MKSREMFGAFSPNLRDEIFHIIEWFNHERSNIVFTFDMRKCFDRLENVFPSVLNRKKEKNFSQK